MRVGDTFHQLMDRAHSVRPHIRADEIEYHVQDEVEKWFRQVCADLAASVRY